MSARFRPEPSAAEAGRGGPRRYRRRMPYDASSTQSDCHREEVARIRDRVLLYARGLDLEPVLAVQLALESMRGAGLEQGSCESEGPALPRVMNELRRLLDGRQRSLCVTDARGAPLASMPPLNRLPMLPEEMDRSLLKRALKKLGALCSPASSKPF